MLGLVAPALQSFRLLVFGPSMDFRLEVLQKGNIFHSELQDCSQSSGVFVKHLNI